MTFSLQPGFPISGQPQQTSPMTNGEIEALGLITTRLQAATPYDSNAILVLNSIEGTVLAGMSLNMTGSIGELGESQRRFEILSMGKQNIETFKSVFPAASIDVMEAANTLMLGIKIEIQKHQLAQSVGSYSSSAVCSAPFAVTAEFYEPPSLYMQLESSQVLPARDQQGIRLTPLQMLADAAKPSGPLSEEEQVFVAVADPSQRKRKAGHCSTDDARIHPQALERSDIEKDLGRVIEVLDEAKSYPFIIYTKAKAEEERSHFNDLKKELEVLIEKHTRISAEFLKLDYQSNARRALKAVQRRIKHMEKCIKGHASKPTVMRFIQKILNRLNEISSRCVFKERVALLCELQSAKDSFVNYFKKKHFDIEVIDEINTGGLARKVHQLIRGLEARLGVVKDLK